MARYRGPKNRIARRFGTNIFGKARNPLLHKPNPPGMHGLRRRKKSDYGLQLDEKQKLKAMYGMLSEKQLIKSYKEAFRRTGNTAEHFIAQLECRLDNIVYRLKLAPTIFAAHQLVSHGHILVNGNKVDRRSFQVSPGMVISIKESSRKIPVIRQSVENASRSLPPYLTSQPEKFTGQLMAFPSIEDVPFPIEVNVSEVCDFLTHTT